jgi:CMP/dCMP kinase
MIILISGMPGAGKSSLKENLAERLRYQTYSTGDIQRELAAERGMTITEWGEAEKKDPQYDIMVDKRTEEIFEKKDRIVMDTWIGPHFIKEKDRAKFLTIFLDCEETERARRRLPQKRTTEAFNNIETIIKDMRQRVACNRERWLKFYSYDFLDMANYDLIIDTTKLTPVQVADHVQEYIKDFYG